MIFKSKKQRTKFTTYHVFPPAHRTGSKDRKTTPTQDKQVKQAQANLDPRLYLFVMSSAPAKKSAGDARCASQDPSTHDKSHKISTQIRIRKCSSCVERNNLILLRACKLRLCSSRSLGCLFGITSARQPSSQALSSFPFFRDPGKEVACETEILSVI